MRGTIYLEPLLQTSVLKWPLIVLLMLFVVLPFRHCLGQQLHDFRSSVEAVSNNLQTARVSYRKDHINTAHNADAYLSSEVDYFFSGQRRLLREKVIRRNGTRTDLRTFDGLLYHSVAGGSVQLHDSASALAFPAIRFDSIYLNLVGIYVPDPLLRPDIELIRNEHSVAHRLSVFQFDSTVSLDGNSKISVRQSVDNVSEAYDEFILDPDVNYPFVRRVRSSRDGEKLSETTLSDFRPVGGNKEFVMPWKVSYRQFGGVGTEDFDIKVSAIETIVNDSVFHQEIVKPNMLLADHRGTTSVQGEVVGTTVQQMDRVVSTIKSQKLIGGGERGWQKYSGYTFVGVAAFGLFVCFLLRRGHVS